MSGRRKHRTGTPETRPDLPITPMLDMSFQLMAFFILTFRPTPTEAQLPLALPKQDGGAVSAPPPITDVPVDDDELPLQVYADAAGRPARVVAVPKTGEVELGADTSPASPLMRFLQQQHAAAAGRPPRLKFEFAEGVDYQYVIKLLDLGRRAGFRAIVPSLLEAK